jgi:hypothetical protein
MSENRHENAATSWAEAVQVDAAVARSINKYRTCAAILRGLAADAPDSEVRIHLLMTAAQFDRLADYAAASGSHPHAA